MLNGFLGNGRAKGDLEKVSMRMVLKIAYSY